MVEDEKWSLIILSGLTYMRVSWILSPDAQVVVHFSRQRVILVVLFASLYGEFPDFCWCVPSVMYNSCAPASCTTLALHLVLKMSNGKEEKSWGILRFQLKITYLRPDCYNKATLSNGLQISLKMFYGHHHDLFVKI